MNEFPINAQITTYQQKIFYDFYPTMIKIEGYPEKLKFLIKQARDLQKKGLKFNQQKMGNILRVFCGEGRREKVPIEHYAMQDLCRH